MGKNGKLIITRVSTTEQEADIFTKPLPLQSFEYLRKKFMGWCCILTTHYEDMVPFENVRVLLTGW